MGTQAAPQGAPVDAAVVAQLRGAAAAGRATRCIYEAGNSACQARGISWLMRLEDLSCWLFSPDWCVPQACDILQLRSS